MVLMVIDHVRVYSGVPAGGPTTALISVAERARGRLADAVTTFGRVPMFFYLLHIPLTHVVPGSQSEPQRHVVAIHLRSEVTSLSHAIASS